MQTNASKNKALTKIDANLTDETLLVEKGIKTATPEANVNDSIRTCGYRANPSEEVNPMWTDLTSPSPTSKGSKIFKKEKKMFPVGSEMSTSTISDASKSIDENLPEDVSPVSVVLAKPTCLATATIAERTKESSFATSIDEKVPEAVSPLSVAQVKPTNQEIATIIGTDGCAPVGTRTTSTAVKSIDEERPKKISLVDVDTMSPSNQKTATIVKRAEKSRCVKSIGEMVPEEVSPISVILAERTDPTNATIVGRAKESSIATLIDVKATEEVSPVSITTAKPLKIIQATDQARTIDSKRKSLFINAKSFTILEASEAELPRHCKTADEAPKKDDSMALDPKKSYMNLLQRLANAPGTSTNVGAPNNSKSVLNSLAPLGNSGKPNKTNRITSMVSVTTKKRIVDRPEQRYRTRTRSAFALENNAKPEKSEEPILAGRELSPVDAIIERTGHETPQQKLSIQETSSPKSFESTLKETPIEEHQSNGEIASTNQESTGDKPSKAKHPKSTVKESPVKGTSETEIPNTNRIGADSQKATTNNSLIDIKLRPQQRRSSKRQFPAKESSDDRKEETQNSLGLPAKQSLMDLPSNVKRGTPESRASVLKMISISDKSDSEDTTAKLLTTKTRVDESSDDDSKSAEIFELFDNVEKTRKPIEYKTATTDESSDDETPTGKNAKTSRRKPHLSKALTNGSGAKNPTGMGQESVQNKETKSIDEKLRKLHNKGAALTVEKPLQRRRGRVLNKDSDEVERIRKEQESEEKKAEADQPVADKNSTRKRRPTLKRKQFDEDSVYKSQESAAKKALLNGSLGEAPGKGQELEQKKVVLKESLAEDWVEAHEDPTCKGPEPGQKKPFLKEYLAEDSAEPTCKNQESGQKNATPDESMSERSLTRKRRGPVPKKKKAEADLSSEGQESSKKKTPIVRSRGRGPKTLAIAGESGPQETSENAEASADQTPLIKRRGRLPRAPIVSEAANKVEPVEIPRKRGRASAKNLKTEALANNESIAKTPLKKINSGGKPTTAKHVPKGVLVSTPILIESENDDEVEPGKNEDFSKKKGECVDNRKDDNIGGLSKRTRTLRTGKENSPKTAINTPTKGGKKKWKLEDSRDNSNVENITISSVEQTPATAPAATAKQPSIFSPISPPDEQGQERKRQERTLSTAMFEDKTNTRKLRQFKVCLTMVPEELVAKFTNNGTAFFVIVQDPLAAEILIMDGGKRTYKFLVAIAKGIPILRSSWLEELIQTKSLPTNGKYILHDSSFQRRYKFSLITSLEKARCQKKIFEGYDFLMTPSIKPAPREIKTIITCAGGTVHQTRPPPEQANQRIYLVSSAEDQTRWHQFRRLNARLKIISTEGIMLAVMRQTTAALEEHLLS